MQSRDRKVYCSGGHPLQRFLRKSVLYGSPYLGTLLTETRQDPDSKVLATELAPASCPDGSTKQRHTRPIERLGLFLAGVALTSPEPAMIGAGLSLLVAIATAQLITRLRKRSITPRSGKG